MQKRYIPRRTIGFRTKIVYFSVFNNLFTIFYFVLYILFWDTLYIHTSVGILMSESGTVEPVELFFTKS